MGRRQYLSRLALGRSAYQEPDDADSETPPLPPRTIGDGDDAQRYDSKGRPINPDIDAFNADMRQAQNEVLALVGVVEKKNHADQANELRFKYINKHRQDLLVDENDRGELLEYLILPFRYFSHLWSDAFRQRIQIGFYDTSRPISEILATESRAMYRGPWKWSLATRYPAVGSTIANALVRLPLIVAVEQATGRLQKVLIKRRTLGRQTVDILYKIMSFVFDLTLIGIDAALLPMEYHAIAQRLGLAPVLPLFPPLKTFLPWHPESFHQYGWRPILGIAGLGYLTSPAVVILIHKAIHRDEDDREIPPFSLLTNFRYPEVSEDICKVDVPRRKDPIGCILHYGYSLRNRFMQWAGWNIVRRTDRLRRKDDLENDTRIDRPVANEPYPVHRSTVLARLPAQFLVEVVDRFFATLLALPFKSLMLRTVAITYLAAPVAKTAAGIETASRLYRPFGGGPLMRLLKTPRNVSACSDVEQYISRLGLSIALTCVIDAMLFSGVYRAVRQLGVRHFDWGRKGKIGKVIYNEAGMEGFDRQLDDDA